MKKNQINNIPSIPLQKRVSGKYKIFIMVEKVDSLLQLTLYINRNNPSYDIFIDIEKEDWLSKVYNNNEVTYSVSMIDRIVSWWWDNKTIYVSNENLIYEMFKFENEKTKTAIAKIRNWQQTIRNRANDAKLEKKFSKWDEELSLIPKQILPSFEKYMRKEADGNYFMFFENKNATSGYCSHCGKDVPLMKAPKQNDICKCPSCRRKATLKRSSQITSLETNWYNGAYAQKVGDNIIIRKFSGIQSYRGRSYDNPLVKLEETVRYILYKNGTVSRYWYGMYNSRICRWVKNTKPDESWPTVYKYFDYDRIKNCYTKNLADILKHSSWSLLKKKPCNVFKYLIIEHQTQGVVEKLVRIGLVNMSYMFMEMRRNTFFESVNINGKDLGQIIKLDKARLKRLVKNDSTDYYKWLLMEKQHNTFYSDEVLNNFVENGLTNYNFKYLPPQMSCTQVNNYILKQSRLSTEDYKQVLTTWRDYLMMAERNGWNLNSPVFYKPDDLKEMHAKAILFRDGTSIEEEVATLEKEWPEVDKNLALMKKFEYENDEFCIIVPRNIEDIVKEGHSLQHCIHQVSFYFDRMSNRETYVFFLRKKAKRAMSWYTIEVQHDGTILQKRTTKDNQNKDLNVAIPFLKEFQSFYLSQMSEEDKLLGIKAEKRRQERYSNLRKDEAKIWHGKLAGKLLVDVLEADLIVA